MPRTPETPGSVDVSPVSSGLFVEADDSKELTPRATYYARGHEVNDVVIDENERLKDRERFLALWKRQQEIEAELQKMGITITRDDKFTAKVEKYLKSFEPAPASAPESAPTPEPTPAPELTPVTPAEVAGSAIKNRSFSKYISDIVKRHARGIVAGLAVTLGVTGLAGFMTPKSARAADNNGPRTEDQAASTVNGGGLEQTIQNAIENPDQAMIVINTDDVAKSIENQKSTETAKDASVAGETINGVKYDYSEYNDREHKTSRNAYGYDYSDQYGDRAKTTEGILHMASAEPEALASYAYELLTKSEKQELGIDGLTMVQIDNKFDKQGGGDLQKKLIDKLTQILEDQEKTDFKFYYENGTENTHYIYFTDDNGDGMLTPDELHIGYDVKKRNNAPQVDIYRTIENADGTTSSKKLIDLNMYCGYQPNYVKAPTGVKRVKTAETSVTNVTPAAATITGGSSTETPPTTITPPGTTPPPGITPPPDKPDPDPTPTPPPPTPTPKPKDADNLTRIDENIKKTIEENIGTGELVIPKTEDVTQVEELTEKPTGSDYQGTEATTTQNETSGQAETVTNTSPANDATENQGGANADNAEAHPVQEDQASQEAADRGEIKQNEAPESSSEVRSELADLGIE